MTPKLEREVLLVPEAIGPDEAGAVALALHASVTRSDGRWWIARPAKTTASLRQVDAKWLGEQAETVASHLKPASGAAGNSPSQGTLEALRAARRSRRGKGEGDFSAFRALEASPVGQLLAAILRRMSVNDWAGVTPGATTFYSNRPIGSERPLTDIDSALASYLVRQEKLTEWTQGAGQATVDEKYRWVLPRSQFVTGDHTVILRVSREGTEPTFTLFVYDPVGALEASINVAPTPIGQERALTRHADSLGTVDLPPESVRKIAAAKPNGPGFQPSLLSPAAHDPLDLWVKDALVLYGKAKGFQRVIACVPDDLLTQSENIVKGLRVDLDELRRAMSILDLEEMPLGKTLVLRPRLPLQEEALRIDRRPLATAFQSAATGSFGLDALLNLHAAYAGQYENSRFLSFVLRPMVNAFHLTDSPNSYLPHPVLAVLGDLTPEERDRLAKGDVLRLRPAAHPASLWVLAQYASERAFLGTRNPGTIAVETGAVANSERVSAMSTSPTRLLANPAGFVLSGGWEVRTLVKRVTRGPASYTPINMGSGERKTERKKSGVVIDHVYKPFNIADLLGPLYSEEDEDSALKMLDQKFRFQWIQERQMPVTLNVAQSVEIGPFVLRVPMRGSEVAVPLSEVPVSRPRTSP